MKKQFLAVAALAITSVAYGQVGINTTTPATTLDITAKNATGPTTAVDGLMIPRVDRQRAQNMNSVPVSTMIYVNSIATGAASGIAVNIDAVGFYYYDGTAWAKMGSGAGAAVTANNGLTQTSGNIQLGGALTQATTISGLSATNTLAFTGTGNNAFSVDGSTLSVDADNDRIGLHTANPLITLHVNDGSTSGMSNILGKGIGITSSTSSRIYLEALGSTSGQRVFQLSNEGGVFGIYPLSDDAGATVPAVASAPSIGVRATTGKVGILNASPAATLDITARNSAGSSTAVDGILIPRVTRERAGSMNFVPVSTLVYISEVATGGQTGATVNVDAAGFYYSDGSVWQKMGGSTASAPLNVTSELDTNYTALASDDIILFNTTAPRTLTLPTSGIAVGKKYYISLIGSNGVDFLPAAAIRSTSYPGLNAGTSGTIMYLGGGKWDVVSGY